MFKPDLSPKKTNNILNIWKMFNGHRKNLCCAFVKKLYYCSNISYPRILFYSYARLNRFPCSSLKSIRRPSCQKSWTKRRSFFRILGILVFSWLKRLRLIFNFWASWPRTHQECLHWQLPNQDPISATSWTFFMRKSRLSENYGQTVILKRGQLNHGLSTKQCSPSPGHAANVPVHLRWLYRSQA